MGIFNSAPARVDPSLEDIFIGGCAEKHRDKGLSILGKKQRYVLAITSALRPGEEPVLLAIASSAGKPHGDFLLVTNQRSAEISGSYVKEIEHGEVAEVEIIAGEFKISVFIHSQTSRLDYNPNDNRRFDHIIMHNVATPRQASQIREAIERSLDELRVTRS